MFTTPSVYPSLYSVNCGSRSLCWAAGGFPANAVTAASLAPSSPAALVRAHDAQAPWGRAAAAELPRRPARGAALFLRRQPPLRPGGFPLQGAAAMMAAGASPTNGVILRSINGGTVWSVRAACPAAPWPDGLSASASQPASAPSAQPATRDPAQYATLPQVPLNLVTPAALGAPGAFNYIASDASGRHVFAVGTPSLAIGTTALQTYTAGTGGASPNPVLPSVAIASATSIGIPVIMVRPRRPVSACFVCDRGTNLSTT